MNRANKLTIDLLKASNEKYREAVKQICSLFLKQKSNAKDYASKFKSEDDVFRDSMRTIIKDCREKLHAAQKELAEIYEKQAVKLEDSVQEALMHALNVGFVQRLDFYRNTGMKPTKSEIEALIALADNHMTALAGINVVLENNGCNFRVKHTTVASLEKDLESLHNFAKLPPYATTTEQAEILTEILGESGRRTIVTSNQALGYTKPGHRFETDAIDAGVPVRHLVNGRIVDNGQVYTFQSLNAEAFQFGEMENRLSEMQSRWSGVTTPAIDLVSAINAKVSDGTVEDSTEIVEAEDRGVKLARELAQEARKWKDTSLANHAK